MGERKSRQSANKVFDLLKLLDRDKRYSPEVYSFIMAALNFTMKGLKRKGHISGEELLAGIKEYTIEEFGPMSRTVLEYWGITTTNDFGEIVFNMINAGLLGKTEKDSKEDFNNRFNFKTTFDKGYRYTLR